MVSIKIKWNKENYDNVQFDPASGVDGLKTVVYNLTHVPKDRQKLMAKGVWTATLKDDFNLSACPALKDGIVVLVMGTAEVVATPVQQVTFLEDMTTEQKALAGASGPAGLVNLGNTCYLNSVLQSFRYLPELRSALENDASVSGLVASLRDLYRLLDRSSQGVPPVNFLSHLRREYPVFGSLSRDGRPMQQDAEEAFGALMTSMKSSLPYEISRLFEVQLEETLTCSESNDERVVTKHELANRLVCNITSSVDHMIEGLRLGLEGTVDKYADTLGRDATWLRRQRIASLPQYLPVQFMRFFWKATPDSTDHTGLKCKIMRAVSFPRSVDVYELCTPALQSQLSIQRNKASASSSSASSSSSSSASANATDSSAMEVDNDNTEATAAAAASTGGATGVYDLQAIVTHKGRSADSGHYMSYVRLVNKDTNQDEWYKFDDATVTVVTEEEVLRLCGGGDRDMAYFCIFALRK